MPLYEYIPSNSSIYIFTTRNSFKSFYYKFEWMKGHLSLLDLQTKSKRWSCMENKFSVPNKMSQYKINVKIPKINQGWIGLCTEVHTYLNTFEEKLSYLILEFIKGIKCYNLFTLLTIIYDWMEARVQRQTWLCTGKYVYNVDVINKNISSRHIINMLRIPSPKARGPITSCFLKDLVILMSKAVW